MKVFTRLAEVAENTPKRTKGSSCDFKKLFFKLKKKKTPRIYIGQHVRMTAKTSLVWWKSVRGIYEDKAHVVVASVVGMGGASKYRVRCTENVPVPPSLSVR